MQSSLQKKAVTRSLNDNGRKPFTLPDTTLLPAPVDSQRSGAARLQLQRMCPEYSQLGLESSTGRFHAFVANLSVGETCLHKASAGDEDDRGQDDAMIESESGSDAAHDSNNAEVQPSRRHTFVMNGGSKTKKSMREIQRRQQQPYQYQHYHHHNHHHSHSHLHIHYPGKQQDDNIPHSEKETAPHKEQDAVCDAPFSLSETTVLINRVSTASISAYLDIASQEPQCHNRHRSQQERQQQRRRLWWSRSRSEESLRTLASFSQPIASSDDRFQALGFGGVIQTPLHETIPLADFSSGTPEMTLREEVLLEHMRGQERKLLQHAELIEILYEEKHKLMERQVQLEADPDKAVKSLEAANVELKKIQKREDWLEEMLEKTIEEKDLTDKRFEASKECIEEHLAAIRILTARSEKAREREEKAADESNALTLRLIAMESQRNRLAKDLQAMEAEIVSLSKENLDMRVVNEQLIYEQQLGAASIDSPITEHPSILSETYQQSLWEELNKGMPWSDTAVDPATVPLPEDYQNDSDGSSTLGTALSASSGLYRSAAFSDNDSEGRVGDGGCRSLTSSTTAVAASLSAPIATPQDPALQQLSSDLWAEVTALIESRLGVFEPDFREEFRGFKQSIKEAQERATQELRRDLQEFVQVNSVQQSESVRATEQRMGADLDAVQRQVSLKLEAVHQQLNDTVCNAINNGTQSKRDGDNNDKRNNGNDRITNNNTCTRICVIAGGTLFTIALITILKTPEAYGIHRSGLPSVLHQISTCVSMRTGFLWLFHAPWCAFGEFLYYMAWDTVQSVASPN